MGVSPVNPQAKTIPMKREKQVRTVSMILQRVIQNSLTSLRISDSLIYTESLLFFFSSLALSGTAEAQPFARVKQMMRELTRRVQQQQSLHMPCAIMFTVRLVEQRKSSSHFKDQAPGSVYLPRF